MAASVTAVLLALCSLILSVDCLADQSRLIRTEIKPKKIVRHSQNDDVEILNFANDGTIKRSPQWNDPEEYLDALAANLTAHVNLRVVCEPGRHRECLSTSGPAKTKHAAALVRKAFKDGVVGDFVETGTWRGGISIMARMAQVVSEGAIESGRRTYVCDSFQGLPLNTTSEDTKIWASIAWMKTGIDEVRSNFARFHALDDQVYFVKGFFQFSLPRLRHQFQTEGRKIAVLRGDGDMFESYYDILYNLYEFIPVGGYFICDDCSHQPGAAKAVEMFRRDHDITEPYQFLDVCSENYAVYLGDFWWKKAKEVNVNYDAYLQWNTTRHVNPPSLLQVDQRSRWTCDQPPREPMRFW